jgi:hypothetical protein
MLLSGAKPHLKQQSLCVEISGRDYCGRQFYVGNRTSELKVLEISIRNATNASLWAGT